MRRATLDDLQSINDWVFRDSGQLCDFTGFLSDHRNVILLEGEGGAAFVWHGPGVYEVHVFFEQRGREAIRLGHAMLDWMRNHGAELFWSAIPLESRHVIMFTRLMGWTSQGCDDFPHGRCELFAAK